jgi:hypothetical protein
MTTKLIVASRLENLTPKGPRVNVILLAQTGLEDDPLIKLEIGNLNAETGTNFPLGRVIELKIPTYANSPPLILVPK